MCRTRDSALQDAHSPYTELPELIPALEEPITDPSICVGPGYSESKWIAEGILLAAREKAGLKTVAARLGQVCGGYNGYWNEREWFPAVVKSALHVKCLPSLEGVSVWHSLRLYWF